MGKILFYIQDFYISISEQQPNLWCQADTMRALSYMVATSTSSCDDLPSLPFRYLHHLNVSLEWHPSHHLPSISSILWSTNEAFPPIFFPQDHSRINYDVIELLLEYIEARLVGHQWEITYRRCTWYQGSEQFAHVQRDQGAILVFLQLSSNRGYVKSYQGHVETKPRPGMMEITKMHERLRGNPLFSDPSSCREPKSNVWFGVFFC